MDSSKDKLLQHRGEKFLFASIPGVKNNVAGSLEMPGVPPDVVWDLVSDSDLMHKLGGNTGTEFDYTYAGKGKTNIRPHVPYTIHWFELSRGNFACNGA